MMINSLCWVLLLVIALYSLVLLSIIADLVSGIRKAKMRGEYTSSHGLRRTVAKVSSYYNALFALTVIDAMQVAGVYYLASVYGYNIPMFPIVTLVGAIGLASIELKSIFEKSEHKQQYTQVAHLAMQLSKNEKTQQIATALLEYIQDNRVNKSTKEE